MSNEVAILDPSGNALAPVEQPKEVSIMQVIARAASDPRVDVAKMSALLDMQERISAKEAEIAYNRAYSEAKLHMPRIVKRGTIDMGSKGSMKFATYMDVDKVVSEIERRFGFTRSFTNKPSEKGVEVTVHLHHEAGHVMPSTMTLPPDAGAGRNAMQAIGSAHSYAKRYLTLDIWNIITVETDDDGQATGYISDAQLGVITDMLSACGIDTNEARKSAFLKFAGAKIVGEIKAKDYDRVMVALRTELQKQGKNG